MIIPSITQQPKFEYITGIIERITYHNPENGFVVIKVAVKGRKDLLAVTGTSPSLSVGEQVTVQGNWVNDLKYGLGFKAHFIRSIPHNSLEGIEKYLGSGLIKGIGPYFAKKLVTAFKDDVFQVIEEQPEKLRGVPGIGALRASRVQKNWLDQKAVKEIMYFLQSHGVSTLRATRIYKTYGEDAIKKVSENPYQIARDIRGIGFLSADKIAKDLGIGEHSLIRARAGISYALNESLNSGHCGLPVEVLIEKAEQLLSIPKDILIDAINHEVRDGHLISSTIENRSSLLLAPYYHYERNIALKIQRLLTMSPSWGQIDAFKALEWVQAKVSIRLADIQQQAINTALKSNVSVITGGPGTGKTTILSALLKILAIKQVKIKLCAPTGRAAKRLFESTGCESVTIHRLLKFNPIKQEFEYNQHNPLKCDLLVVDESSMIDVQLLNALLKALPDTSSLILVGDIDQLPSVGAGQVLKDIIDSSIVPVVRLSQVFRQGKDSNIITNAHLVNKGLFPKLQNPSSSDFHFIEADTPEEINSRIIRLVAKDIPNTFKLNTLTDVQVLTPMQRGGTGARSLNVELQRVLNHSAERVVKFGQTFAVGDKVMQMENNYDKDIYNGDIGFIRKINMLDQQFTIEFDGKPVTYSFDELDELSLAYAVTIHKSQGSEYPAVVIPFSTQHFPMLKKNLLYTAITRGKRLVILVGQKRAIAIAVRNTTTQSRYTKLKEWLMTKLM